MTISKRLEYVLHFYVHRYSCCERAIGQPRGVVGLLPIKIPQSTLSTTLDVPTTQDDCSKQCV